ncbi:MAG: LysE family transporter [Bacteroidota bacterium]
MAYLIAFLAGFVLSYVGSMPLGMINLTVAETTIQRGYRPALTIALGASLVELIQSFVSIQFTQLYMDNPQIKQGIALAAIPIFAGIGLYYLLKPPKPPKLDSQETKGKATDFFKGVLVSALNLLAFPYWVFYGSYLSAEGLLAINFPSLGILSLGVGCGTMALLWTYARLSLLVMNRMDKIAKITGRVIGGLFLALALWQLIRWFWR